MRRNDRALGITSENATWDDDAKMWFRPETLDSYINREAKTYLRRMPPRAGDVLLDIGANIGCVSRAYLAAGADKAIAIEPEPDNVRMMFKNLADELKNARALVFDRAVVAGSYPQESIKLSIAQFGNRGNHSTVSKSSGRRPTMSVPVVRFPWLLDTYQPTLVKCDIEGGEYALADELASLPRFVKALTVEFHMNAMPDARERARDLDARIQQSGLEYVAGPKNLDKSWFVLRTYRRKEA